MIGGTLTSGRRDDFDEIIDILEKRLNDNGKNWRHVQKVTVSLHSSWTRIVTHACAQIDTCPD